MLCTKSRKNQQHFTDSSPAPKLFRKSKQDAALLLSTLTGVYLRLRAGASLAMQPSENLRTTSPLGAYTYDVCTWGEGGG